MIILFNRHWIVVIIVFVVLVLITVFNMAKTKQLNEYSKYLISLEAEDIVREHFKNRNEKDIPKLKETVIESIRNIDWNQNNLEWVKILEISINDHGTELFADSFNNKGISVADVKVLNVTYEVKYKKEEQQNNGIYTWRYDMIKKSENEPWLINSFGF